MYYSSADLLNVFEQFLPQLLLYPNPSDPLNGEAASLLLRSPDEYRRKVKGMLYELHSIQPILSSPQACSVLCLCALLLPWLL